MQYKRKNNNAKTKNTVTGIYFYFKKVSTLNLVPGFCCKFEEKVVVHKNDDDKDNNNNNNNQNQAFPRNKNYEQIIKTLRLKSALVWVS